MISFFRHHLLPIYWLLSLLSASTVIAQTASASPTPVLTAEQKASLEEATELSRKAVELHSLFHYDDALPLAQRALDLRRGVFGDNNASVAESLSNLGSLYFAKENYDRAEELFKKALAIYDKLGTETPNTANVLDTLTALRWRNRDYAKGESYGQRALALKEKLYGQRSPHLIRSLNNLSKIYDNTKKLPERNALYLRVASILENKNAKILDRQVLYEYRCNLRNSDQTPEVVEIENRLASILAWDTSTSTQAPVNAGVLNPKALSLPKPSYPPGARAVGAGGIVVVQVVIDECGKVINVKTLVGDETLRGVCEESARSARFAPTMMNGVPIRVTGVIQYQFMRQ